MDTDTLIAYIALPEPKDKYGSWLYDRTAKMLRHEQTGYEVDLERMGNSAAILDWICQVGHKRWVNKEDIGWLVVAINDIVHPQYWACSWH